ncbi:MULTISPECIES: hypothetical protein [Moorena]|nr:MULTISPECIES: hypothetical protein [Moorena]
MISYDIVGWTGEFSVRYTLLTHPTRWAIDLGLGLWATLRERTLE